MFSGICLRWTIGRAHLGPRKKRSHSSESCAVRGNTCLVGEREKIWGRPMPHSLRVTLALAVLSVFSVFAVAAVADVEVLRELTRAVHEKQQNVGVQVCARRAGLEVFSGHIGMADLEHSVAVTDSTQFGIASITKLFTATAVLKLEAEGLLDLDAPVRTYVPQFPEKPEGAITVRMLLEHRSGIPHPSNRTPKLYATHYESAMDAVEVFAGDTLLFEPGSDTRYSSSNYNLLAAAVEGVTGKRFVDFIQESILDPLHLDDTAFDDVRRVRQNRARRYSFYHPWNYEESDELFVVPIWDYSFNPGGGNMISTARDITRFGEALMAPGLLPAEQWNLLVDLFGQTDEQGRRYVYASGANPGLQAGLALFPEQGVSAAVLSNTWGKGSRSGDMVKLATVLAQACISE